MKRKIIAAVCAVVLLAAGTCIGMLAAGGYGSEDDPLITLSYLNDKLKPELEADVAEQVTTAADEFSVVLDERLDEYESTVGSMLDEGSATAASDTFSVLTLTTGQRVTCAVGAEIMLRIGEAKAAGDDYPALIDTTGGASVSSGTALITNHMYMVTIRDCGVIAASDTVKILIRGTYTVS